MVKLYKCATPSEALKRLMGVAEKNEKAGRETVVFCDSMLTMEAEKAICDEVGGTFDISVYTFAGYLSRFARPAKVLSRHGSAMVLGKIIDEQNKKRNGEDEKKKGKLNLFENLPAVDAADSVYDTISRFYASGITPEELEAVVRAGDVKRLSGDILQEKLEYLCAIYSEYEKYLAEHGKEDRNGRLRELPKLLKDQRSELADRDVIFFGYREFSKTGEEIVEAAMECAGNAIGIFLDGDEKFYTHVARESFERAAAAAGKVIDCGIEEELGKKPECSGTKDGADGNETSLSDNFRQIVFNPAARRDGLRAKADGKVILYEARDEAEEMEYIAAQIRKCMCETVEDKDGDKKRLRYRDIAVAVPDVEENRKCVERAFARYGIPCYTDTKISLSSHPLYSFVQSLLLCVCYGAAPSYVDDIAASPYFPGSESEKTAFRNYMAKYGKYKGAVLNETNGELFMPRLDSRAAKEERAEAEKKAGEDAAAVERMRKTFVDALNFYDGMDKAGMGKTAYERTKALFESDEFDIKKKSEEICSQFEYADDERLLKEAELLRQAPEAMLSVMEETANLCGNLGCGDYLKVLRSGADMKTWTLAPAKLDAVYVCDVSRTLLADKRVVFAAEMSEDVPALSHDTRLISDRDIDEMKRFPATMARMGPTTGQDNSIKRETVALNVSSFSDRIYLGYSKSVNGTGHRRSEVFDYAFYAFSWNGADTKKELKLKKVSEYMRDDAAYYCSELDPAVMWTERNKADDFMKETCADVTDVLEEKYGESYNKKRAAAEALGKGKGRLNSECAKKIYSSKKDENSFAVTTIEEYFKCPYKAFVGKGLRADGRADDDTSALDIGNLYHETFEKIAREYLDPAERVRHKIGERDGFAARAGSIAREMLEKGSFKLLAYTHKGEMDIERLVEDITAASEAIFEQLERSDFDICRAEDSIDMKLYRGYSINGKADRVDTAVADGVEMVRVIDYKTGRVEVNHKNYYVGKNLQPQLYLLAETKKLRDELPVGSEKTVRPAGAFYLSTKTGYKKDGDKIVLEGFADGTEDTMKALDYDFASKEESHMDAKCPKITAGRQKECTDRGLDSEAELREDFCDYLEYAKLVATGGITEMAEEGYIEPSPIDDSCDRCKLNGICGFDPDRGGKERHPGASIYIDNVVKAVRGKGTSYGAADEKKEGE